MSKPFLTCVAKPKSPTLTLTGSFSRAEFDLEPKEEEEPEWGLLEEEEEEGLAKKTFSAFRSRWMK